MTLRWGDAPNQLVDVYRPAGVPRGVVALIHGGFWQAAYGRDQLVEHCRTLAADGYVAGNVGYRRVGEAGGGWPGTCDDVVEGLRTLRDTHGPLTAVVGHSAGGHLALWAAKELDPAPQVVISVAGCIDLALAHRSGTGRGAVDEFLGNNIAALSQADPAQRLPLGTRVVLLVAQVDRIVPAALSESYEQTAVAAGDEVELRRVPGDHFSILDVGSGAWNAVLDEIGRAAP